MGQLLRCVFQCQAVFEIRVGRRSWLVLYAWNLPVRYYHITARGDRSKAIHEDDEDRQAFLGVLASVAERFNWLVHAYGLMSNHYHRLVETPDGNLLQGMRQLNGVYRQYSNRRHGRTGHLLQGRYKAILV